MACGPERRRADIKVIEPENFHAPVIFQVPFENGYAGNIADDKSDFAQKFQTTACFHKGSGHREIVADSFKCDRGLEILKCQNADRSFLQYRYATERADKP